VDSKISEIRRTGNSTKKNLRFDYDAMGNRIAKHIFSDNTFTVVEKSTYYVRDASGNTMLDSSYFSRQRKIRDVNPERNDSGATYEQVNTESTTVFNCTERHIYGSSRIGMEVTTIEFVGVEHEISLTQATRTLGNKQYEITNHLGNVLAVITDRKLPYAPFGAANQGVIHSYYAQLISVTDYTAFGVSLEGRTWSDEGYRYGFQNQEHDNELWSGAVSFQLRIQDARTGRFLSCDPMKQFASPYLCLGNNPVNGIDPDGGYFFRLFGSTSEQRKAARAYRTANGGEIKNVHRESIYVERYGAAVNGGTITEVLVPDDNNVYHNVLLWPEASVELTMVHFDPNTGAVIKTNPQNWDNPPGLEIHGEVLKLGETTLLESNSSWEGESGLMKYSENIDNVGNVLTYTPLAPVGQLLNRSSDAINTGLDYKNKSLGEANRNLCARLVSEFINIQVGRFVENNKSGDVLFDEGGRSFIEGNVNMITDVVTDAITEDDKDQ
jgi:RHS repeat-associated protein